ncbi:hypothetical protein DPMN_140383 [Dreissena polymorpha]|uniref:Uncharacterized protein n=1 Tax=Dreissena polymorpha TaxID=45954 RepID=A0A9D4GBF9_DREPO|nr:hypothetical protein DPMN_140383 [Dreissena polymorpha]
MRTCENAPDQHAKSGTELPVGYKVTQGFVASLTDSVAPIQTIVLSRLCEWVESL